MVPPPMAPVMPMMSPFMMPPTAFAYFTPPFLPPPPMPLDLAKFTDEELRAMEGHQRENIEQRLKVGCGEFYKLNDFNYKILTF